MHQDSMRSVVYRSFVTCEDPKGVVECGTIRKSKTSSQKSEHKMESRKAKKIPADSSLSHKDKAEKKEEEMVSKGVIAEEFHSPSSFQLLEVSRGAEKLNQMIDSWSKGKSYDGQSKDVGKDLLKGALDLQESLMMLGKLQEASQYKGQLKKQQKEQSKRERNHEAGVGRTNSYHFGDRNYQMGFQKPRHSVDGSSRDCYDELREVIRDSFARQNLLSKTDGEEKIKMDLYQRNLDSASEFVSTSSSQSSMTHTNYYSSVDSPLSSTASEKKAKGPSLIAKLMGLEEIPSKPLHMSLENQFKKEKISSQGRPVFGIDMMPKVRNPQSVRQHENPERKTLKEILETMQFKGLLKSNSVKELKSYPQHSSNSHSRQRLFDNMSPIVLIKPVRSQFLESESEKPFEPMFHEKGVQDTKMVLKNVQVKEELPSTTIDRKEEAVKSGKTSRKAEAKESPIKRFSKEEGAKESKRVVEKLEEKEAKIKQRGVNVNKVNSSGHATHQPQKKNAINKKADKTPKVTVTGKKPIEKEIVKSKNTSRSQDQVTKVRNPENGSNLTKNQSIRQRNSIQNAIPNHTKQSVNHTSNDRKRSLMMRKKPTTEPSAAKLTTENGGCEENDRMIDLTCKNDSILVLDNVTCADQLPEQEETDATEFQIAENYNNSVSSLSTSEYEMDPRFVDEVTGDISHIRTENKGFGNRTDLKQLLLSSPKFLNHAEELFDLNSPTTLPVSGSDDIMVTYNERLSLDCANELMERKSSPDSKLVHPLLLTWLTNPRIYFTLDQLLDEVEDGVETLRSYSKLDDHEEHVHSFSLYKMLEKDLSCNGVISGIWDLGWRNECCVDDTEKVVNDIQKLLLSGLIDEIFT